jgi:hypothetical protein
VIGCAISPPPPMALIWPTTVELPQSSAANT